MFKPAIGIALAIGMFAPALADNIVGDAAILRTLDKVTASTKDYTVPVGESLTYGTLTIDVKHCEKKPPEDIPETFVFLQIFDHKTDLLADIIDANDGADRDNSQSINETLASDDDSDAPLKLFSGWMLATKPAVSALDHPVYDVWVIDCIQTSRR